LHPFSFDQSLKELSFDLASREDVAGSASTLDFEDLSLPPTVISELECTSPPLLETHEHARASIGSCQGQLPAQTQQCHRATGEERDQMAELQDLDRKRRRVLTTFDEILGERKIPTALL
jgi:hypothetical protein